MKLHQDLKQSWEHLRAIAKHETFTDSISTEKKMKSAKFLTEAAERLKVLEVVHRRVLNRIHKLYLYMGMTPGKAEDKKVNLKLYFHIIGICTSHKIYEEHTPFCIGHLQCVNEFSEAIMEVSTLNFTVSSHRKIHIFKLINP